MPKVYYSRLFLLSLPNPVNPAFVNQYLIPPRALHIKLLLIHVHLSTLHFFCHVEPNIKQASLFPISLAQSSHVNSLRLLSFVQ